MSKALWKVDWSKVPKNVIGVAFNHDGQPWGWTVKPSLQYGGKYGDLKWRGPVIGEGFVKLSLPRIEDPKVRDRWQESWLDAPKAKGKG